MDSILVNLVTVTEGAQDISISKLIADASPVVKGVLAVLVLMSVISWYIIVYKWLYLRRAQGESALFLETFWQSKRLDEIYQTSEHLRRSPVSQVFRAGYVELTKLKSGGTGDISSSKKLSVSTITISGSTQSRPSPGPGTASAGHNGSLGIGSG